ncbi:MAG: hypothetical protein C4548_00320 [Desulfobacteraceae bacterium]|jgi:hypothetical protein|nr:MAG: hypothetical protein C4548_00320 [Desulfobacteraceae bacterium]
MKTTNFIGLVFIGLVLVAVTGFSGCASTGMQRSTEARATMETMDNDIKLIVAQLDAAGASLNELTRPGQSDAKKAFDLYSDNISKLIEMENKFSRKADEMKDRGNEYFEEWQKEGNKYKNSEIQRLSEQRRMELAEIYDRIPVNSIGVKDAFKAYVSDAKEIQIYLSNDLTSRGIEAIAPIARRVANEGDQLKYELKALEMSIERARAAMAQSGR